MAAQKGAPSLAEYAASLTSKRNVSWCDTLPDDVQRQLLDTDCSAAAAVAWLKAIGHGEATQSKVDNWRRKMRDDRDAQPR